MAKKKYTKKEKKTPPPPPVDKREILQKTIIKKTTYYVNPKPDGYIYDATALRVGVNTKKGYLFYEDSDTE